MIFVTIEKPDFLALRFEPWHSDFHRYLAEVRTLSQRRYTSDDKGNRWVVPVSCFEELQTKFGEELDFDTDSLDAVQKLSERRKLSKALSAEPVEIDGFGTELLPHQHAAVRFVEAANGEALILDEVRVGKAIQTLAYIQKAGISRIIIVAPSITLYNWKYESEKLLSPMPTVSILSGRNPKPEQILIGERQILVINYEILKNWVPVLQEFEAELLIVDESHRLKDRKSQAYNHVADLRFFRDKRGLFKSRRIPKFLSLTGTPLFNRHEECWTNLHLTKPESWSSFWTFAKTFTDVTRNGFGGFEIGKSINGDLLNQRMQYYVMRRKLKDVMPFLPSTSREFVYINLDKNHKCKLEYDVFENNEKVNFLEDTSRMRQDLLDAKLPFILDWIEDFLSTGKKLAVFGFYHNALSAVYNKYKSNAVRITGKESAKEKDEAIQLFQGNDATKLAVCSQKSVLGINLTAADTGLFLEPDWSAQNLIQNEGRFQGLTQKKNVTCYYIVAPNTIDDYFLRMVEKKNKITSKAIDGKAESFIREV